MLDLFIAKGQYGLEKTIIDFQGKLIEDCKTMAQKIKGYYSAFQNLRNQGLLNVKYRENELKANVERNLTQNMIGYEMYNWEIFQSLKVIFYLFCFFKNQTM